MSPDLVSLRTLRSYLCELCGNGFDLAQIVRNLKPQRTQSKTAKDANKPRFNLALAIRTTPSFHIIPEHPAIFHHKRHVSQDVDIAQRIAVDGDDVGVGAGRYHPDLARHIEHIGGA